METTPISSFGLTKLQLFREVKRYVLTPMNHGDLSAKRAGEILTIVEEKILAIRTPDEVNAVCIELSRMFPELTILKRKLELKAEERIDDLVSKVIEEVVTKGDLTLASLLFDEMASAGDDQAKRLDRLQSLCPIELKAVQDREAKVVD